MIQKIFIRANVQRHTTLFAAHQWKRICPAPGRNYPTPEAVARSPRDTSKIRRKGGNNNNPNALQFKWALRALLQRNGVTESHRGNCNSLPEVNNTLFVESSSADATPLPADFSPIPQLPPSSESPDAQLTKMLLNPGIYHDHVLHYIAGFICRR
ncbi:THAP domain-containing protein 9 [Elysia marginata]|uniref:THAP domain-containing protein 9 n=1 Tax=Elysia marginata TaxID=1093978 RepID=A0AAV4I466_9GAST|nr:THAP domain-containing protein 9 [Elysia marginata]